MKLRDICNNNTAVQLKEIAKSHGLSGYSKMKKGELVELLANHLLNYDTIEDSLLLASDKELEAFEQVCSGKEVKLTEDASDYVYFFMQGYYNINAEQEISVPDEVKRMFPIIYSADFRKKRLAFQNVLDYCKAGVNLYGIVPIDQIVKIYNQNQKVKITKEELLSVVKKAQARNCVVEVKGEDFIHELITTSEHAYDVLLQKQGNKPFYIPSKSEFLNYADDTYVEKNAYYNNCIAFLKNSLFMSDEMAEAFIYEVECMYSEGLDTADILNGLVKEGLEFTGNEQKQAVSNEIVNYTNHVRLWENRGNNKVELGIAVNPSNVINFQNVAKTTVRSGKKVGRNDLCPCGSGKKYKFCCGR